MAKKHIHQRESQPFAEYPLSFFACPHPDGLALMHIIGLSHFPRDWCVQQANLASVWETIARKVPDEFLLPWNIGQACCDTRDHARLRANIDACVAMKDGEFGPQVSGV